ncbi:MAG: quaternary amine ABC transporter ATP-binding protein [Hyphomicrobiales bacterium]
MSANGETALECRSLWRVFGAGHQSKLKKDALPKGENAINFADKLRTAGDIVACGDIDLKIKQGEFFVLMGLSGSGKSTLMRCMSRLTEPSAGELLVDGEDFLNISDKELMEVRRRKMGMVFQHFGLFPHMTVQENVAFPLRVQGTSDEERNEKAQEMINLVGLEGRESAYPHQLSGGQKQRVGIARSLAVDPELWFLDEPFSALDPLIRWQMQSELLRLQTLFHKTIIFVTHDFMEAVRLADRIAIMKDGLIVQVGTPEDIVLNPSTDYVAEFVKEAPRTKIIKVSQLMEPLPKSGRGRPKGEALHCDMTLEDALSWSAERGGALPIADEEGNMIGTITPERLTEALSGESHGE